MKKTLTLFTLFFLFAFPSGGLAHALEGKTVQSEGVVVVEFIYSTGDAARYVKAEVYSPDNSEIEHQAGRTDKNGRFSFYPDIPGEWKVIVSDNQGHRAETFVLVSEPGNVVGEVPGSEGASTKFKVALGLSLILNLALIGVLFSRRKSAR